MKLAEAAVTLAALAVEISTSWASPLPYREQLLQWSQLPLPPALAFGTLVFQVGLFHHGEEMVSSSSLSSEGSRSVNRKTKQERNKRGNG